MSIFESTKGLHYSRRIPNITINSLTMRIIEGALNYRILTSRMSDQKLEIDYLTIKSLKTNLSYPIVRGPSLRNLLGYVINPINPSVQISSHVKQVNHNTTTHYNKYITDRENQCTLPTPY